MWWLDERRSSKLDFVLQYKIVIVHLFVAASVQSALIGPISSAEHPKRPNCSGRAFFRPPVSTRKKAGSLNGWRRRRTMEPYLLRLSQRENIAFRMSFVCSWKGRSVGLLVCWLVGWLVNIHSQREWSEWTYIQNAFVDEAANFVADKREEEEEESSGPRYTSFFMV